MLQLDSRSISIEGVTVFRDHADPSQFWYLPGPVTLAKRDADQRTQFTYLKYKNRAGAARRGGGFLMIETRLKLDPDLERRVVERLASISRGRPRLAPVPFDDGTVSCVALNLQGAGGTRATTPTNAPEGSFNAVESILGAGKPSLAGDNTAVFSLELSAEGATILEKALKDGTTPIGVIYDLKYTGLRPAFNVKITADFNQVFTHFSTSADGQRGFVRAGIDTGFERLVRSGAIKIEVADMTGTPENETRIKEALDFFKAQVLNTWFTPALTPGTLAATAATAASLDQVRALGEQLRPPQPPAPERPGATPAAPAAPDHGPSPTEGTGHGPAATGLGATGAAEGASAASSPTEGSGEPATSTPPPGGAGSRGGAAPVAAAADRSAPGAPRHDEAVAAFRLRAIRQEERRTATFEYNRAEAQQRSYAPQGFIGLMARELNRPPYFVEIDLDDPFFQTIKIEAKAPFSFETLGLKEIHLQLDYGPVSDPNNHRRQDFVFSADDHAAKSVEFVVNLRKDQTYAWQAQYHFDPTSGWDGEHFSHDAPRVAASDDRTLVLNPMESIGFLQLRVEPGRIDPGVIDFTEVEMAYEDPSGWKREKSGRITAAAPAALEWKLRVSPTSTRHWRYQVRHHLKDGSVVELPAVTTRATSVVVDDPYPGSLDLTIFPIVDFSTVRAAMLDVNYADPAHHYTRHERVRLTPEMTEARVRFSTPDASKKRFSHQLTVVHTDGRTERPAPVETEDDVITVVI